jgi:hypothetical protein
MPVAFISYAHKDENIVGLLRALLKFHGIEAWCSGLDIEGGQKFREEIVQRLSKADALIAVVSQNSAKSKWVNSEIAMFQTMKPESRIVPLTLDSTDPNDVFDGLAKHQAIPCCVEGFQRLFRVFDRSFLGAAEFPRQRRIGERKKGDRSKGGPDRRHWNLSRYRTGLWKCFERARQIDMHTMDVSIKTLHEVATTLSPEVTQYQYRDRTTGEDREPSKVLAHAINLAWQELRTLPSLPDLAVIDTIAEKVWHSFEVLAADRRSGNDRRRSGRREGTAAAGNGEALGAKEASA